MRRRNWELCRAAGLCDSQGFVGWALKSVRTPNAVGGVSFPASPALAPPAFAFPETQAQFLHLPLSPYPFLSPSLGTETIWQRKDWRERPRRGSQAAEIKSNFSWVRGFPLRLHHTLLTSRSSSFRSSHSSVDV